MIRVGLLKTGGVWQLWEDIWWTKGKVPQIFGKRDSLSTNKRELDTPCDLTYELMLALLAETAGSAMFDVMSEARNKAMGKTYSDLKFPKLRDVVVGPDIYKTPMRVSIISTNETRERQLRGQ